ncbi:hypothetical protein N7470_001977 [Penicillium chermesinum]|nr:hypothetical protein N7470_001977 [Penicillium chermesinum]
MGSTVGLYLPTEIVVLIAEWANTLSLYSHDGQNQSPARARQKTMYNLCLVNHQWYSAAVGHLYAYPDFLAGSSFVKFAQTISPPSRFNKSKTDLGTLVLTSRLLGRVSKNLRHFTAPRASFGVNALASLAKCHNLTDLDLSLIGGKSISFPRLKKSIAGLPNLSRLILPTFLEITHTTPADGEWPRSLTHIIVGGHLDAGVMFHFDWPANLTKLTISGCKNLNESLLHELLSNKQLVHLPELEIWAGTQVIDYDLGTPVLFSMPALRSLTIPVQMLPIFQIVDHLLIRLRDQSLPLRVLKLNEMSFASDTKELADQLIYELLDGTLGNLWSLGIRREFMGPLGLDKESSAIDHYIMDHVEKATDEELDAIGLDEVDKPNDHFDDHD